MREKNYNLEIIRVFSFVMVILIHVSNYFCRGYGEVSQWEYGFSAICNVLSRISVPCFFMLSGGLLLGREEDLDKSLQRTGRFLVVLVFWSVLYFLFNTYVTGQETFKLTNFWRKPAEAHLWYLYVMIPIYLVLPYLQAMMKGITPKMERFLMVFGSAWMVVNYILSIVKKDLYFDIPLLGNRNYLYYLYVGYFLVKYKDKIKGTTGKWLAVYFGGSVVSLVATLVAVTVKNEHTDTFFAYGSPVMILSAVSFFVAWLRLSDGKFIPSERVAKWIGILGSASFGIYLTHIFYLDLYKVFITREGMLAFWAIPVLTIVVLVVSFATSYLLGKIPFIKKFI